MSSKDTNEMRTMHSKSDNIESMIVNEAKKKKKKLFDLIIQKYQKAKKK